MSARLAAFLPRLAALVVIGLLAAASITFAATQRNIAAKDASAPLQSGPKTLVVPDVRHQAYVFAKGILDDAGFSWNVVGSVKGYAANVVAVQDPAPGTRVLDTGAPTVALTLQRNPDYSENGLPENTSAYAGSKLRLANGAATAPAAAPADGQADPSAQDAGAEPPASDGDAKKKDKPKKDSPAAGPRTPDFVVPGAPAEPTDEMPLPDRAQLVQKRVAAAKKPTRKLVNWWLYQHSWIVTGAKFGWHDGAKALRILVGVDRSIEARWGFGARSTALAERTLKTVERKSGH
jgi:beta-lactam-binding protein with PASTA domain